jgi:hypothetical protein
MVPYRGVNRSIQGRHLAHAQLLGEQQAVGVKPVLGELEIAGNFASMGIDPGQLFETQLPALV